MSKLNIVASTSTTSNIHEINVSVKTSESFECINVTNCKQFDLNINNK